MLHGEIAAKGIHSENEIQTELGILLVESYCQLAYNDHEKLSNQCTWNCCLKQLIRKTGND